MSCPGKFVARILAVGLCFFVHASIGYCGDKIPLPQQEPPEDAGDLGAVAPRRPAVPPPPVEKSGSKPDRLDESDLGTVKPPTNDALYKATVQLGESKSGERVLLFWSAADYRSISELRKVLKPFGKKKVVYHNFFLSQIFDTRDHDMVGPGALLLCAQTHLQYAANVIWYVTNATGSNRLPRSKLHQVLSTIPTRRSSRWSAGK